MDWLPDTIRRVSLPSAVFFTLFVWNGIAYLGFARILPLKTQQRLRFLLFGLLSLSLAVYSIATFELYSATDLRMSLFCNQLQLAAMVPAFIFFVMFAATYFETPSFYFSKFVPIATLAFVPFLFWDGKFFQPVLEYRTFAFFGYTTRISEVRLGPWYFLFLAWTLPHVFFLGWRWFRQYRDHFQGWALPVGASLFVLSVVNDILLATEVYRFFYTIEMGFAALILSMAFQLFKFYVATTRELEARTREVAALSQEMQFLVGAISHDLKAPLISIRGFSELLQKERAEMPEKRREYLGRIEANAAQMLEWIDDLIHFMKVGWVLGESEAVDLAKTAAEVEGLLQIARESRRIVVNWPASWPPLRSSGKGVKQILLNLLQNAVKFSPEGGSIRVQCFRDREAVQFWVEDHGSGVPAELRERIFQPFFRHHGQVPGFGMGLAIVRKATEKLGGRVWLDATYEGGARFCVYLPDRGPRREV
ncbi:MAG: HAMP domain-containing histidine kinase [Deltaproteobacteria bacterium]|nr:HAMP domain-containing histidine kinase [Deltaproteobacteria bacterium]